VDVGRGVEVDLSVAVIKGGVSVPSAGMMRVPHAAARSDRIRNSDGAFKER